MGRRWGKTVLGGVLAGNVLRQHGAVGWIAPTYKNARPLWRLAARLAQPLATARVARINHSERMITTHLGGLLAVYSGDNIDAVRSEAFNLLIADEAARLPEGAWEEVLEPTLADAGGEALLISTPKGKNWFYREWEKARQDGVARLARNAPTSANPNPRIRAAYALAQERVPEFVFAQEWDARFIDQEGLVFRHLEQVFTGTRQDRAQHGHSYTIGADWGKSGDYSVFAVWDDTLAELCHVDRSNRVDYFVQRQRLRALWERFGHCPVLVETNSIGEVNLEQLKREELLPDGSISPAIQGVKGSETTNASKAAYIEAWALAFERGLVKVLDDPTVRYEHEIFERGATPSGLSKYAAPEGEHDDTVIGCALAYQHARGGRRWRPEGVAVVG